MQKALFLFLINFLVLINGINAQIIDEAIRVEEIKENVTWLASDRLKGRVNYSPEQMESAQWLTQHFERMGLSYYPGMQTHVIPFYPGKQWAEMGELRINGNIIPDSLIYFYSPQPNKRVRHLKDFLVLRTECPVPDNLLHNNWESKENVLIWVNLSEGRVFSAEAENLLLPEGEPLSDILVVGLHEEPTKLSFKSGDNIGERSLYNIAGILPGKGLKNEMIMFSAHYDHVATDQMGRMGLFNGANDNASGTAAVLALAKYYSMRKDNERTLVFCLFAGEELGLYGSEAFVGRFDTKDIKAVINIEMIGKTNVTGNNGFFLTGGEKSTLGDIMSKNLVNEKVKLQKYSDKSNLFIRSDNISFFLEGIPAHSIMCSDDKEPCYHKPCDDADRIDFENLTEVIKAIAKSVETLVNGKDTPVLK